MRRRGGAARPVRGRPTMLSWPDELCEAIARGGRRVVRYDLRDSGAARRSPSILKLRRTRCATLPPTRQRSPANYDGPRT